MGRLNPILRALNLAVVDLAGGDSPNLVAYLALQLVERMARVGGRLYHKLAGDFLVVVIDADVARRAGFVNEALVQPRAASVAENRRQRVQRRLALGEGGDGVPSHVEARQLNAVGRLHLDRPGERRIRAPDALRVRACGNVPEVALD